MLDAIDSDFSALKRSGGKILYWTGWLDLALTALGTIGCYAQVEATDLDVRDYARLFMLPGVLHCAGGRGRTRSTGSRRFVCGSRKTGHPIGWSP